MIFTTRSLFLSAALLAIGGTSAQAGTVSGTVFLTFVETQTSSGSGSVNAYNPNTLSTTNTNSETGETASGYADLSTSSMGISMSGTMQPGGVGLNPPFTLAEFADTITATGATTGLNLGVNLTVDGTSTYSDPTQGFTALLVAAYAPGGIDSHSAPIFGEGFILGGGTLDYSSYFSSIGVTYAGSYGTGAQSIPLNIPFATLGSNFQLAFGLATEVSGTAPIGTTWNVNYINTLQVALAAPEGVSLTSASGLAGTTAATPEPGTIGMLGAGLLALGLTFRARRRNKRV